jgi:hypothetical protein
VVTRDAVSLQRKETKVKSYSVLNALPAKAFLNPEDFRTSYDASHTTYKAEQYAHGLAVSNASLRVGVTAGGTWFAEGKDGSFTSSYEGVGYHACTADLLRGFLDGSAEVVVYRYKNSKFSSREVMHVIREAKSL